MATLAVLLVCASCKERTPSTPGESAATDGSAPDASGSQAEKVPDASLLSDDWDGGMEVADLQPGITVDMPLVTHLLPLAGNVDVANRYLSAVRVTVRFNEEQRGFCSGAIISRRLILTAGHCVCQQRQAPSESNTTQGLIDGSACAKTATVSTTAYGPPKGSKEKIYLERTSYEGQVHPHPMLRILLGADGRVASSNADLAVIALDEPLEKEFPPLPLADEDLQLNESIVIVGSGYDETARAYDGERRASINKVIEDLPSSGGRMRILQPGGHHYRGDSGGPCLREGPGRTVLVGISSRNLGEGEALQSIHGYLDWLRSEIQRAERKHSPHPK